MNDTSFDEELDVRNRSCPYPALRTRDALDKLVAGQVLRVVVSSERSVDNIRRQLKKAKGKWLSVEEQNNEWIIFLERIN